MSSFTPAFHLMWVEVYGLLGKLGGALTITARAILVASGSIGIPGYTFTDNRSSSWQVCRELAERLGHSWCTYFFYPSQFEVKFRKYKV